MAQYFHQSGVGGYQGNYASGGAGQPYQPPIYQPPTPFKAEAAAAPLLYNNEPNIPRSPPTNQSSLYNGAHEANLVPWEILFFSAGALGLVFIATALTTIGGLYYIYGDDWTWSKLGADTIGRCNGGGREF